MRTILRAYHFDLKHPDQKEAYEQLKAKLTGMGLRCFETHGGTSHHKPDLDGKVITLQTDHLFPNQWNSDVGRVFDWAQDYNSAIGAPRGIKRGHWLEQTREMDAIRRTTLKCGYCGAQEPTESGHTFCPHCIDSEYLKEQDLHLTRMVPVADTDKCRAPLSPEEEEELIPKFRKAQIHGATERGKVRIAKERDRILKDHDKTVHHARVKRDGLLWLMDHGIRTDNVIYYDHRGSFCFGWRTPYTDTSRLLAVISEFPFPYEIKCTDGRVLSHTY